MLRSKRNVRAGAVLPTAAAFAELGSIYLGQTYGSTPEERHKPLPGDDVVPNPQVVTNHATTIDVPLDAVWPWLVQMGWHRAGCYTARWVAIGHIVDLVVVGGAEDVPMLALPLGTGHQGQRPQIGSGPHHTAVALAAAIDLAGQAAPASTRPSVAIPVGTAVHTGEAFVGATGLGTTVGDFTALGDVVNITARLASAAPAGEVIVSVAAAEAAEMKSGAPWRSVDAQSRSVIVLPAPDTKVLPDEHHV